VRDAHGWREEEPGAEKKPGTRAAAPAIEIETQARARMRAPKRVAARKPLRAGPKALKKSASKKVKVSTARKSKAKPKPARKKTARKKPARPSRTKSARKRKLPAKRRR